MSRFHLETKLWDQHLVAPVTLWIWQNGQYMGSVSLLRSDAVANRLTNDSAAFKWKLHCHRLIGLRQRQIAVVIWGSVPASGSINPIIGPDFTRYVISIRNTGLGVVRFTDGRVTSCGISRPSHAPPGSGTCQSGTPAILGGSRACSLCNTVQICKIRHKYSTVHHRDKTSSRGHSPSCYVAGNAAVCRQCSCARPAQPTQPTQLGHHGSLLDHMRGIYILLHVMLGAQLRWPHTAALAACSWAGYAPNTTCRIIYIYIYIYSSHKVFLKWFPRKWPSTK